MRTSRVPPDGGYGWVVVAGCALVNVFNQSLVSVFGLMFADYLASLGEHAFGAALVMNVCNISLNFSGLITGPIIKQFKPRKAAILGSLLTGSALTLCSYSTKLWQIVLSYSVSFGFGLGLIQSSTFVALNSFFRHRKGRAVGFALAGTGVGQILMPLLVQYLLSNFNFRDTTLIIGGLAFNGVVGACLLQPVEWHLKESVMEDDRESQPLLGVEKSTQQSNGSSCSICLVVARSVMAEMRSLLPLMITSAFYGIFRSITIVNQNLTVAEYCGERQIEKMLPNALGFNMVTKGILVLSLGQILGWFADFTGSYSLNLHAQNLLLVTTCVLWLCEMYFKDDK
uniref:Major facilitator superfamily (MFS) profile domain-containing protein n=1 Tax=Anopheles culicifacies TaxID=139723 RepID=A0A182MSA5_9DIPT